jgi:hypothetical protein
MITFFSSEKNSRFFDALYDLIQEEKGEFLKFSYTTNSLLGKWLPL